MLLYTISNLQEISPVHTTDEFNCGKATYRKSSIKPYLISGPKRGGLIREGGSIERGAYSGFQLALATAVGKSLGNLGVTLQNSQLHYQIW